MAISPPDWSRKVSRSLRVSARQNADDPECLGVFGTVSILISYHRDGIFISGTLRHLGVGTIAGSSSRGGGNALIAMFAH